VVLGDLGKWCLMFRFLSTEGVECALFCKESMRGVVGNIDLVILMGYGG